MKKRVGVILHNDLSIDGRVLNELSILSSEYDIRVLCTGAKPAKPKAVTNYKIEYLSDGGIPYKFRFISNTTNSLFETFWIKQIAGFIEKHDLDLIHAHDLYMLAPSLKASEAKNIPVIIDLHENYPEAFRTYSWTRKFPLNLFVRYEFWDELERKYLGKAAGLVVLSSNFQKDLQEKYNLNEKKFAIYPNVPDLDFYKDQKMTSQKSDDVFRLFYLGVVGYSRGLHIASEAVKILRQKGYNVELHIAGKVHKNDKAYFEKEVLNEFVVHIPWIDLEHLGDHLSKMDIGISPIFKNPQHESGIANKVYQYMLFSKPILVSDCAPQEDLAKKEQCGLVHKDQEPSDFAEKVEWFINHPEKSKEMGKRGREAILDEYNTTTKGRELVKLYESILSG